MCRRRRFKDRALQRIYDLFRADSIAPERIERVKAAGALGNAYANGVRLPNQRCSWQRNSPAYAAWAAGVDNARCAAREGK